jgi:hypothetical protein
MNKNIFIILTLCILFVSCTDLIDPATENIRGKSSIYAEPNFGLNLLTNAYVKMPDANGFSFNDVATDDAVSNDPSNGYLKMATGQWTASTNAVDRWASCNVGIQYVNIVINEVDKMKFSENAAMNKMFKERVTGEAYGLRAVLMYSLLQSHAGWVKGKLLGVPILLKEQTPTSDLNLPRADFQACTAQIYHDIDSATVRLPMDYADLTSLAALPARYSNLGITNIASYNNCMGLKFLGLVSGRILKAYRSKTALLAASPAFEDASANAENAGLTKWESAAVLSASLINTKLGTTGIAGLAVTGNTWYANTTEISGIAAGSNPPEILWRSATSNNNTDEGNNFPPSLFGNGRINPTQNLVDAFPDKNGYPITNPATLYVSTNPYANRDPRLSLYIIYHGSKAGVTNASIDITGSTGTGLDAVNKTQTSTRTGYYMKKLLRQDVNYNPTGRNTQLHYRPRVRYTEIYLDYAEAANEAWGPIADPKGCGFTAYDVIKAIRKRALNLTTDAYLESIKSDQVAMRKLIRNERRLELCFEGFRFYDLRRWKVTLPELTAPAMGITVTGTLAIPVFSASALVESRLYQDYMYYGPIPYSETLKFDKLLQNDNWNK